MCQHGTIGAQELGIRLDLTFFLSFLFLPNNLHRFKLFRSVTHNIVAGGTVIAQRSAKALMSRRQIVHVHIGEHIYGVDIKTP